VALADGRALLVWRDAQTRSQRQLRYALIERGGHFSRSRGVGLDGLGAAVAATSDGGAVIAWATPCKKGRALRAARLRARRQRLDRSVVFLRSALVGTAGVRPGVRLAGGPDGVVVASWVSAEQSARLLARRLLPLPGPVRTLARVPYRPSEPRYRPEVAAAVALGPADAALATFSIAYADPNLFVAAGTSERGFAEPVPLDAEYVDPGSGEERAAILPSGEALAVWSQSRNVPGPSTFDIVVARRLPGAASFAAREVLAPGMHPVLAHAANRVIVAWPAPGAKGGVSVSERSR
jgi:hypothetical protein